MIKKIDLYLLSHVFKCTVYVIFVAVGIYALLDTLLQFSDRVSVHHSFFFRFTVSLGAFTNLFLSDDAR